MQVDARKLFDPKNVPIDAGEEAIAYDYWSYLYVLAAGTSNLNYFGYARGGSVPGAPAATSATQWWTNLTTANQIAAPYRFMLLDIAIDCIPAEATVHNGKFLDDKREVLEYGYASLKIGAKEYETMHLKYIPEVSRYVGGTSVSTLAAGPTIQTDQWALVGPRMAINDRMIVNNLSFEFPVMWDSPATPSADLILGVRFRGVLVRPKQ